MLITLYGTCYIKIIIFTCMKRKLYCKDCKEHYRKKQRCGSEPRRKLNTDPYQIFWEIKKSRILIRPLVKPGYWSKPLVKAKSDLLKLQPIYFSNFFLNRVVKKSFDIFFTLWLKHKSWKEGITWYLIG